LYLPCDSKLRFNDSYIRVKKYVYFKFINGSFFGMSDDTLLTLNRHNMPFLQYN